MRLASPLIFASILALSLHSAADAAEGANAHKLQISSASALNPGLAVFMQVDDESWERRRGHDRWDDWEDEDEWEEDEDEWDEDDERWDRRRGQGHWDDDDDWDDDDRWERRRGDDDDYDRWERRRGRDDWDDDDDDRWEHRRSRIPGFERSDYHSPLQHA